MSVFLPVYVVVKFEMETGTPLAKKEEYISNLPHNTIRKFVVIMKPRNILAVTSRSISSFPHERYDIAPPKMFRWRILSDPIVNELQKQAMSVVSVGPWPGDRERVEPQLGLRNSQFECELLQRVPRSTTARLMMI